MAKKKGKIRADFRKNRNERPRKTGWTREFARQDPAEFDAAGSERIGRDELTRRRTVVGNLVESAGEPGASIELDVDEALCRSGRVLGVRGLISLVQGEDGTVYQCATRRLLRTLSTDQRHVVAAGDRVQIRLADPAQGDEGIIERVEPRRGVLCRASRGRQQVIVANVDQLLIIASAADPPLKPNLIDRLLIAAEKGRIRPIVVINKIDLADPPALERLSGVYSRMGYQVLLISAVSGFGVERLRRVLANRETVVAGQSGVGKSSLLNAVHAELKLRIAAVSSDSHKGKHTTTTAELFPLPFGGWVVDTPGVRQFELWDVIPAEVANYFRDLRPYVSLCRFPDCSHTHEADCGVKNAVADGRLDERRYENYCTLAMGDAPFEAGDIE